MQSGWTTVSLLCRARWGNSRSFASALLAVNPGYAAIRRITAQVRFARLKFAFNTGQFAEDRRRSASTSIAVLRSGVRTCITAGVLALISQAIDHFSGPLGTAMHFSAFVVEPDRAVGFVSGAVQVMVVIAGLYYTALSVVISAGYRDANGPLYDLLTTITPGQQYLRDTMRFAVFGAIILALEALGVSVGPWALSIFAVLLVLDVAAFIRAGTLAFDLFNPRRIMPMIYQRITTEIDAAAAATRRQAAPEIIDTHRRRARQRIDALADVAALCEKDGGATQTIITYVCQLLLDYSSVVPHLPIQSRWFEQSMQHRSWFEADPIDVILALNTATELRPTDVPDRVWFERSLLPSLLKAFEITLERGRVLEVQSVSAALCQTIQQLSSAYAINTVELIVPAVIKALLAEADVNYPTIVEFRRGSVAALALTASTLGLCLSVKGFRVDFLSYVADEKRTAPLEMPIEVNTLLDNFRTGWHLEERAEGQRITPTVYVAEICLNEYFVRIIEQTRRYLALLREQIQAFGDATEEEASYAVVGFLLGSLESVDKLESLILEVRAFRDRSMPKTSLLRESAWSPKALDVLSQEAALLRRHLLTDLMVASEHRAGDVLDSSIPRFADAAFQHGTAVLYDCLAHGDNEMCAALAPGLYRLGRTLLASASSTDRITTVGTWVALDMCELAGYAYLYDDINGTETAATIVSALSDACEANVDILLGLTRLADVARGPNRFGRRSMVRQQWGTGVLGAMRAMTGRRRLVTRYGQEEFDFGSPLLNAVFSDLSLVYDAFVVYCAQYVLDNISPTIASEVDREVAGLRAQVAEGDGERNVDDA